MDNCTLSNSTLFTTDLIRTILAIGSLPMCAVAILLMMYYRFYQSFNYRLILYLLISFVIDAMANSIQLPFVLSYSYTIKHQLFYDLCEAAGFLQVYCLWNIQLTVVFLTAEVFSMIVFSAELRQAEIPLTFACFSLPAIPAFVPLVKKPGYGLGQFHWCGFTMDRSSKKMSSDMYELVIPGMVLMGICVIAIATALSCLTYCSLRQHFRERDTEEQYYLLQENTRKRYKNALKEILPLSAYPTAIHFLLLMCYFTPMACTIGAMYVYVIIYGSIGAVSSAIFFVHITILGRQRRNTFKNRSRATLPSNTMRPIHEGQRITAIGSITGTHVTDFDPLEESDVEPNT